MEPAISFPNRQICKCSTKWAVVCFPLMVMAEKGLQLRCSTVTLCDLERRSVRPRVSACLLKPGKVCSVYNSHSRRVILNWWQLLLSHVRTPVFLPDAILSARRCRPHGACQKCNPRLHRAVYLMNPEARAAPFCRSGGRPRFEAGHDQSITNQTSWMCARV